MSNEFMYSLSYTTSVDPIQHAFDFSKTGGNRVLDANISYGGMTEPWTVALVGIRGTAPLQDQATGAFAGTDLFSREGAYSVIKPANGFCKRCTTMATTTSPTSQLRERPSTARCFEFTRNLTPSDYVLASYDTASSDTLNRRYVLDYGHNFVPNLKATIELAMSPQNRPRSDWRSTGPARGRSERVSRRGLRLCRLPRRRQHHRSAAPSGAPAATSGGDANNGAKLVQANGCAGCHGAGLNGGGIGPSLVGIEHRLSLDSIAAFIANPKPPMPNFGFTWGSGTTLRRIFRTWTAVRRTRRP